ncbi:unnamed protein product, partial [Porites lobata]
CLINNGGCSHNCINLDGTYICSCPTGNELDSTRKNCVENQIKQEYCGKINQ